MANTLHLNYLFESQASLHAAYMPFIKGGGLFIRTNSDFSIGSNVSLSVTLLEKEELHHVDAKVVWITPKGAQGNKFPGIGVQFISENSDYLCNRIERCFAGMIHFPQATDTI